MRGGLRAAIPITFRQDASPPQHNDAFGVLLAGVLQSTFKLLAIGAGHIRGNRFPLTCGREIQCRWGRLRLGIRAVPR